MPELKNLNLKIQLWSRNITCALISYPNYFYSNYPVSGAENYTGPYTTEFWIMNMFPKKGEARRENLRIQKCDLLQKWFITWSSSENFLAQAMLGIMNDRILAMKSGQILHHCQWQHLTVQGTWAKSLSTDCSSQAGGNYWGTAEALDSSINKVLQKM